MAQEAHGRLGGRPQLLSRDAPAGPPTCHYSLRTVDGTELQRGQHRRRYRARAAQPARGVLRRQTAGDDGRRARLVVSRAARIEWLRHRALAHEEWSCAPAHQSAHQLLLPLRAAGHEQRRVERLRRRYVGPVLHLPGVQRARRMDAYLERHRQRRRVRGNRRHRCGQQALLSLWQGAAAHQDQGRDALIQSRERHARAT